MKRIKWWIITQLAIFCAGYMNWDKNAPEGRRCEDCADYGKWYHCNNCIRQNAGTKWDSFKPHMGGR